MNQVLDHNAVAGDLAVYFQDGAVRHVGKWVSPEKCLSKWGAGFLYEHGLWDIPKQLGNDVRYFTPPAESALRQHLSAHFPHVSFKHN